MTTQATQRPDPKEFNPKPYWSAADLAEFFDISRAAAYRLPIRWTQLNGSKRASLDAVRQIDGGLTMVAAIPTAEEAAWLAWQAVRFWEVMRATYKLDYDRGDDSPVMQFIGRRIKAARKLFRSAKVSENAVLLAEAQHQIAAQAVTNSLNRAAQLRSGLLGQWSKFAGEVHD